MSGAPREWVFALECLHTAVIERDVMKAAAGTALDQATDRYVRAVDQLVDTLAVLRDSQVLGWITGELARRARS